ncbi:hypothetical protein ILYODFUR_034671 [Ilyodon furcidens]|uniref:Uncharacterized protein n=1 Tax=Ilyodon furcidens TaxID=33524 RepID=A0ABV0TDJ5_9TELE
MKLLTSLTRCRQRQNKCTHFYFLIPSSGHPSGPPGVSARQSWLHRGESTGELDGPPSQHFIVMIIWILPETTAQSEVPAEHRHTHTPHTNIQLVCVSDGRSVNRSAISKDLGSLVHFSSLC